MYIKTLLKNSFLIVILGAFIFSSLLLAGCSIGSNSFISYIKDLADKIIAAEEEAVQPSSGEVSNHSADSAEEDDSDYVEKNYKISAYIDEDIDYKIKKMILDRLRIITGEIKSGENDLLNNNSSSGSFNEEYTYEEDKAQNKLSLEIVNSYPDANLAFTAGSLLNELQDKDIVPETTSEELVFMPEPLSYTLVSTFYSFIEEISWDDFSKIWSGERTTVKDIEENEIDINLAIDSKTLQILEKCFGVCKAKNLIVLDQDSIDSLIKRDNEYDQESQPGDIRNIISIVPFNEIKPFYKIISIDGRIVLDKDLNIGDYPLVVPIAVYFKDSADRITENPDTAESSMKDISPEIKSIILDYFSSDFSITNRHAEELFSVIMTGVTALTRQTAAKMDANGITYPAEKIYDVLLDADLTHISNEVSFVEDCFAARPNTMVFCSRPEYIELLKFIDADVIELTGNHLNDHGSKWLEYTLDIYDRENFPYFGGGRNLKDALKPALFEISDTKIAFLGANFYGPSSDWATEDSAGSAPINILDESIKEQDMQMYEATIAELKNQGYNVIFTFQYVETYNYFPTLQQVEDFQRMADAGAVIVSGSQAHQPQGVKLLGNGFINYGLGNLFFGQALGKEVKQGLIAKHYFYEGNYINTEMITTFIEDFSQPRQTFESERAELLRSVFNGSVFGQ